MEQTEKYNAKVKGNYKIHVEKWKILYPTVEEYDM